MLNKAHIGAVTIELLHGVEPGRGFPMAVLFSEGRRNLVISATTSAGIIGFGYLVSSFGDSLVCGG
ncbi:hypothetical protein ACFLUJ_06665 [Chloroflexota bacterium]